MPPGEINTKWHSVKTWPYEHNAEEAGCYWMEIHSKTDFKSDIQNGIPRKTTGNQSSSVRLHGKNEIKIIPLGQGRQLKLCLCVYWVWEFLQKTPQ